MAFCHIEKISEFDETGWLHPYHFNLKQQQNPPWKTFHCFWFTKNGETQKICGRTIEEFESLGKKCNFVSFNIFHSFQSWDASNSCNQRVSWKFPFFALLANFLYRKYKYQRKNGSCWQDENFIELRGKFITWKLFNALKVVQWEISSIFLAQIVADWCSNRHNWYQFTFGICTIQVDVLRLPAFRFTSDTFQVPRFTFLSCWAFDPRINVKRRFLRFTRSLLIPQ